MRAIEYRIGNAYHGRVKSNQGNILHDWEVYVDITNGDINLIRKVLFKVSCGGGTFSHTSHCPARSGSNWRYQIRKRTDGPIKVEIKMVGFGTNSVVTNKVRVTLSRGKQWSRPYKFRTAEKPDTLRPNAIPECNFGIELELSTSAHLSPDNVARILSSATSKGVRDFTHTSLSQSKKRPDIWRIVTDNSLSCPRGGECNKFELVSPILKGGNGLTKVDRVLKALNTISSVEVGKTMGFHVHVDVSKLSCNELVKICQNFIKYERAMDSLMPPSRRKNDYSKSNEKAITSNDPHSALASCENLSDLAGIMNPNNCRYYKLNLQNLVTGKQTTLEFRQHSGSANISKIKNWIRFCTTFVHNSAKFDAPFSLRKVVDDDELFEMLMVHVIDDRYLREFYRERRNELHNATHSVGEHGNCCEGCAVRGQCAAKFLPA